MGNGTPSKRPIGCESDAIGGSGGRPCFYWSLTADLTGALTRPSEERAMLNELLYVLARNYEDARNYARNYAYKKGCHYSRMVNVDRREKLMGLRDVKLHVVPGAEDRKNYAELMHEAKIRCFEIVEV